MLLKEPIKTQHIQTNVYTGGTFSALVSDVAVCQVLGGRS